VTVPVGVEREHDHRQADARPIFDKGHASAIVQVSQLVAGNPPARISPADITPSVTTNAAMHIHADIGWDLINHRKIESRAGSQICWLRGYGRKRQRDGGRNDETAHEGSQAGG
jgi:hypothetical protein